MRRIARQRDMISDPVARLFDAVADVAAVQCMRTGRSPSTRIEYESSGERAFNLRHLFRVYVDERIVLAVARPSLSHAAHRCWIDMQEWADGLCVSDP